VARGCKKGIGKNLLGQRKPKKGRELAAEGEKAGVNGTLPNPPNAVAVEHWIIADDCQVLGLSLRDQHAVEWILVRSGD
jgi:hypothetical protein